jgi:hypothetical protein
MRRAFAVPYLTLGTLLLISSALPPPPPTTLRSLVVNSSHLVDAMLTETEQGKALREMKQLDPGFDEFHFIQEMRDE